MESKKIWQPIEFDPKWKEVTTERFDNIHPSWIIRRQELLKNPERYKLFMEPIKRKQAIDTGIIEQMYTLSRGITETFIDKGFEDAYLGHDDTNIAENQLMGHLKDNFEAMDFVFDYVKERRVLSEGYIKELHALVTRNQKTTEAQDPSGNKMQIPLVRGEFKKNPNNPSRNGVVYEYSPPEQVASEMARLLHIYSHEAKDAHVLVKSALFHHLFTQIHPFQDGNGRIARLLASLVFLKEDLFPLLIEPAGRSKYIDALEKADNGEYQALVDIFASAQISLIEKALNWNPFEISPNYGNIIDILNQKMKSSQENTEKRRQKITDDIFQLIKDQLNTLRDDLEKKLDSIELQRYDCPQHGDQDHYYHQEIVAYANKHNYYANLSLGRRWTALAFKFEDQKYYRLTLSLHHYGYGNETFVVGSFLLKSIIENKNQQKEIDENKNQREAIPLELAPLIISSEKSLNDLKPSIDQQVQQAVAIALAYITNEIS